MIMHELRKIFERRLRRLSFSPVGLKLIMDAFDDAVAEAEDKHRAELARAGIIRAA